MPEYLLGVFILLAVTLAEESKGTGLIEGETEKAALHQRQRDGQPLRNQSVVLEEYSWRSCDMLLDHWLHIARTGSVSVIAQSKHYELRICYQRWDTQNCTGDSRRSPIIVGVVCSFIFIPGFFFQNNCRELITVLKLSFMKHEISLILKCLKEMIYLLLLIY